MALGIADINKSSSDLTFDTVTINNDATQDTGEQDRGANTSVADLLALFTVTGFAAAPSAGGYMLVQLIPLGATGGTEYNDGPGGVVLPVTADALYDMPAPLHMPSGLRYFKLSVTNKSGQSTDDDAASLAAKWQAVTV